ncbi:ATPase [Bacteroidia bacterium]|nr:ATPase [Bacteroidia bacterium]
MEDLIAMEPVKRLLQNKIEIRIEQNKAILIFGARRVGKTILMRQIIKDFAGKTMLLNGEDYDTLALLEEKSIANYRHLLEGVDLLAIDEAQNIPEIGSKLKLILDEIEGIRVIASGSSSFDLLNKAGEPLVGRSTQFHLTPFSQREIAPTETVLETRQNLESRLIYGSYPEVVTLGSFERKTDYLRDIVGAYLLKDILVIDGLKNSGKMKDLLRLIAFQLGNEVSYDELGKQLGMSKNTVEKYLDLLSKVFVVYRLGAYARNLRKEVTKAGKWYFYDNGIRNAIIGNFNPLSIRQDVGALWENYLISERIKASYNEGLGKEFYFWRTYDRQEIDLIEESSDSLTALEFKWGTKKPNVPGIFKEAYPNATFDVINKDNYLNYI